MFLSRNEAYLGDCLKLMYDIPSNSIDFVLCDLPYGTTNCKWDIPIDLTKLWAHYKRIVKPDGAIALFAQTPFDKVLGSSNLPMLRYEWVWEKTHATGHFNAKKMPMKAHENILIFYTKLPTYNPQKTQGHKPMHACTKRIEVQNNTSIYGKANKVMTSGGATDRYPRSVIKFPTDKQMNRQSGFLHDTQKPVALCEYLIETYTNKGDLVLDNCAGSFTTGIACKNTKRDYILIEKDKNTYDKYIHRLNT